MDTGLEKKTKNENISISYANVAFMAHFEIMLMGNTSAFSIFIVSTVNTGCEALND